FTDCQLAAAVCMTY
nr:Chain C, Helicon FP06649 [synthetic construct]7UY2_D Chain D, Helicon FP06649 [synthetic construct]